jgi:hypothetical protein
LPISDKAGSIAGYTRRRETGKLCSREKWLHFTQTFKINKDIEILPLLFLLKRWSIVVLECSEGMTFCLDELATSFAESGKKYQRHLFSNVLTLGIYRIYEPVEPFHRKRTVIA